MIVALIDGERDPQVLAELAKGRLRAKPAALVETPTGRFDEHHAELAAMLLDQIDGLSAQIERLDAREQLIDSTPTHKHHRLPPPETAPPDRQRSARMNYVPGRSV